MDIAAMEAVIEREGVNTIVGLIRATLAASGYAATERDRKYFGFSEEDVVKHAAMTVFSRYAAIHAKARAIVEDPPETIQPTLRRPARKLLASLIMNEHFPAGPTQSETGREVCSITRIFTT